MSQEEFFVHLVLDLKPHGQIISHLLYMFSVCSYQRVTSATVCHVTFEQCLGAARLETRAPVPKHRSHPTDEVNSGTAANSCVKSEGGQVTSFSPPPSLATFTSHSLTLLSSSSSLYLFLQVYG